MNEKKAIVEVRNLVKKFSLSHKMSLTAVNDVSFCVYEGEKLGVVGESGCGKSTLGRVMLQLYDATSGSVIYHGRAAHELNPKYLETGLDGLKSRQENAAKLYRRAISLETEGSRQEPQQQAAECRKQASEELEQGAALVGSLIASEHLDLIVSLMRKAENEARQEAVLMAKSRDLDREYHWNASVLQQNESETGIQLEKRNQELKCQLEALAADAQNHHAMENGYRQQLASMRGKDILPITDRCADDEYLTFLDSKCNGGLDLCRLTPNELRSIRNDFQMIFQDPAASLDPRQTVGHAVEETFLINTKFPDKVRKERTMQLLERVGLKREHYDAYPHNLSGGQKQRVGIARAIAMHPSFIVLDEAVSALDVSVKAQILQLLNQLSADENLTYFFITHDLGVAKHFCDRIMVMYLGNLCELAPSKELFKTRLHPYTESLLDSVPRIKYTADKKSAPALEGEVPSPIQLPQGCPFHTRCLQCMEICKTVKPVYREVMPNHFVACHLYDGK